ncbi:MAG TPA: PadR family transcriptional regulator, partial [Anaerolineaceae bacterium]|nr:PadR family transcriptional regulator [Anaerolineaceae bacterium]
YKALVKLHEDGLVEQEIQYQESLPPKKIYTITDAGRAALKQWVMSAPQLPEFHDAFLVQLAWAELLDAAELDGLLARYEEEIHVQYQMQIVKANRKEDYPDRTSRESYLWEMISKNIVSTYANELAWIRELREGLKRF